MTTSIENLPENDNLLEIDEDAADILTDDDQTSPPVLRTSEDGTDIVHPNLLSLEDEPADFIQGQLDVKEQMDRAEAAYHTAHRDTQELIELDKQEGEIFDDLEGEDIDSDEDALLDDMIGTSELQI